MRTHATAWALAATALALGCSSSGKTGPEKTGTVTSGSCDCCGQLVDVSGGQRCDDPRTCAVACGGDSGRDAGD